MIDTVAGLLVRSAAGPSSQTAIFVIPARTKSVTVIPVSDLIFEQENARARYGSTDAFGRVFRDAYGMTPAAYRATGSHAAFKAANRERDANGFPIFVEMQPSTRCAAVAHAGSYLQIDRAMGRLFAQLSA